MRLTKDFYSTSEVAELLGISRVAVFKQIRSGKLKARKIGRNYAIARADMGSIGEGGHLSAERKNELEAAVQTAVKEYGEAFRLLGRE